MASSNAGLPLQLAAYTHTPQGAAHAQLSSAWGLPVLGMGAAVALAHPVSWGAAGGGGGG